MIKRVIFDIDNTLIPWEKHYNKEINNVLDELKISYTDEEVEKIVKAFSEYENDYYTFDKEKMYTYINKYTQKEYPRELVYNVIKRWGRCVPDKIELKVIKTLEYLKNKYELVILTDWFADVQSERLQELGIKKYFLKIYSAEKTKRKPFKEAFLQAIDNNKPEECIMIGDNLERDIKGALNSGLKAIYYTKKADNIKNKKYYTITKLEEIIYIL